MPALRLGTRRSRLARAQAEQVAARLREAWPDLVIELINITTVGDRTQEKSPIPVGGKGVFVKEIEAALCDARIDLAVHSAKDLPTELPEGLKLLAVPERADPRDCIVGTLPPGAVVGTGSPRREVQLRAWRPDLNVLPLRGNVDTRASRPGDGTYDAVVLAVAGLDRLGLADRISEILDPAVFLPAPGQGALAIEGRPAMLKWVKPLIHSGAMAEVAAERAFLSGLSGGCAEPIAALARAKGGKLTLDGLYAVDGAIRRDLISGKASEAAALGAALAERLLR